MFTSLAQVPMALMAPLPLFFLLSFGTAILLQGTRRKRCFIGLYLALYLSHLAPIEHLARYFLERHSFSAEKMEAPEQHKAKAIVLLGGGLKFHADWHEPSLSLDSLARTIGAASLSLKHSGSLPIIASGLGNHAHTKTTSEGGVMQRVLNDLNVSSVWVEGASRTTYENAVKTKALLMKKGLWHEGFPIILVTSGVHLPRSIAVFKKQGFKVMPVASHYGGSSYLNFSARSLVPASENFYFLRQSLHEYVGFLYYKLTLKI